MMARTSMILTLLLLLGGCETKEIPVDFSRIASGSTQVILIVSESWDADSARLSAFDRTEEQWKCAFRDIPVSLGAAGLGWGPGYSHAGPQKHEGDKRSPAGLFRLGTAFGRAHSIPSTIRWETVTVSDRDYFIDDVKSPFYNQWLTIPDSLPNTPLYYAESFERMMRIDDVYDLGIVIQYNNQPVLPGRGSAIFIHKWRQEGAPTLGCTAMSMKNLTLLVEWLDPAANAVLIQMPEPVLRVLLKIDERKLYR